MSLYSNTNVVTKNENGDSEYYDTIEEDYDDTVEIDDDDDEEMDYEEEEVLMEGNVRTGALTIYPGSYHLLNTPIQQIRQQPSLSQPPLLQPRGVTNQVQQTRSVPKIPFAPPPLPQHPNVVLGSTFLLPNKILLHLPAAYDLSKLVNQSQPMFKTKEINNTVGYFIEGVDAWLTRGLNDFEMTILINDMIIVLNQFQNVAHFPRSIDVDFVAKRTTMTYGQEGALRTIPIAMETLAACLDRIMRRLVIVPRERTNPKFAVQLGTIVPWFVTLHGPKRAKQILKFSILFDKNRRHFILVYVYRLENVSEKTISQGLVYLDLKETRSLAILMICIIYLLNRDKDSAFL